METAPEPGPPSKKFHVTNLGTQVWCLIKASLLHKGVFRRVPIPSRYHEVPKRGISNLICHPGWLHQGVPLGVHLEDSGFCPRRDPVGSRRPPNSDWDHMLTIHQILGSGQGFGRIWAYKGGNVKDVVYQGPFGTVQEEDYGLASQVEPLHL